MFISPATLAAMRLATADPVYGQTNNSAPRLVVQALEAESLGQCDKRSELLLKAVALDCEYAPARWHRGQVRMEGTWRTPDEVVRTLPQDSKWTEYQERRRRVPKSAEGHWELAQWCRDNNLDDERRAHLLVAADLSPNDAKIQRSLGRTNRDGRWLTDEEWALCRKVYQQAAKAYHRWKPELTAIRRLLLSRSKQEQAEARRRLSAITDPMAVPAMEDVLSTHSPEAALSGLEVLQRLSHRAASRSLIRHAVYSKWAAVRRQAIEELAHRNPDHVIPDLIASLGPETVRTQTAREFGNWRWQDFETTFSDSKRSIVPAPFAAVESQPALTAGVMEVAEQRMSNARDALESLTGETFPADLKPWMNWWFATLDQYFDPDQFDRQQRQSTRRFRRVEVLRTGTVRAPVQGSCFAAGTPVWTKRGISPIEQVELGDLVLSQNPDSGELAFRAVVGRTIRPRVDLVAVQVGGESLRATLGHPFWVSGRGWVKARDLKPHDPIRTSNGVELVSGIEPAEADYAYNLIVAEFGTYFVGESRVLVHDNSPIRDTAQLVPGLRAGE
jgi:hypothetical protein